MMGETEFYSKVAEIGGDVYVAGGWIRDRLMGRCPHDKDYVICKVGESSFVSKFPQAVRAGTSFPVFILTIDGRSCDVAMARTEEKTGSGYKGFKVAFGPHVTIEEDLFRRDTTINSMAWSPAEDKIIDPFGGREDIKAGIIRATSSHFCEDPVRALRAARQAAEFDFTIEDHTLELMACCGRELIREPGERIFRELKRAMLCSRPSLFFSMLAKAGILGAVIRPLDEIWKRQSDTGIKDFSRVMDMLDKTADLCERPEVRFASLVRFICHGSEICEDILDEIDIALRLPRIWRRCAEFAAVCLPLPEAAEDPSVAVDTLAKLQNHPIGTDGCSAILTAEGIIGSYPFLVNSELYIEAMKKAGAYKIPEDLVGSEIGRWIRAQQISEVGMIRFK